MSVIGAAFVSLMSSWFTGGGAPDIDLGVYVVQWTDWWLVLLGLSFVLVTLFVKNTPGEAGHRDFDTADASSGDDEERKGAAEIFKLMLRNPVIMTIACIEFCSGFLRQAIMQWFRSYAKQTDAILGMKDSFVYENWGMLLCCAGIMGGVVAGVIARLIICTGGGPDTRVAAVRGQNHPQINNADDQSH